MQYLDIFLSGAAVYHKKLYVRIFYWVLIFAVLFIPSAALLALRQSYQSRINIPYLFVAFFLFLLLFIFFRLFSKWFSNVPGRSFSRVIKTFDDLLRPLNTLDNSEELFWKNLYHFTISGMAERFRISCCYFYLYDARKKHFECVYSTRELKEAKIVSPDDSMVKILYLGPRSIELSILYTDTNLAQYRADAVKFFNENDISSAVPFFNTDKKLAAFLLLGSGIGGRDYPAGFISGLEIFRIQLQQQIERRLILEEVKKRQIIEHDTLLVREIKHRINPLRLRQAHGIRISSFHAGNSATGGDYIDAVKIGNDRIALFMADSSYAGVNSAAASLVLFSVLHSLPLSFDSPGKALSIMNRVLLASRFSRHAPAVCAFVSGDGTVQYSNAAFNPPVLFHPSDKEFIECDRARGVPVGVDQKYLYETEEVTAEPGSIGIIYSGGIISSINGKGEEYSLASIKNIIKNNSGDTPAVLARKIYRDFSAFLGGKKQVNEASLVIFKICES